MNNQEIVEKITSSILRARQGKTRYEMLYTDAGASVQPHEFLFFIKPEITMPSEQIDLKGILTLVFAKLALFNFHIRDIRTLAASYLEEHDIIARHYGVINALSRKPLEFLTNEAKEKFRSLYGKKPEQVSLLGGIEFLQHFPSFTPFTLDELWQSHKAEKLAGGTYCARILVEGKTIYLINGFHPKQLIHFTEKGRSIIAFTLTSHIDWTTARNNFIGKTNPAEASKGSLRNEILNRMQEFGLQTVSSSQNGFHLSAGPVEALVELIRYCSDYASGDIKVPEDFIFGRQLHTSFQLEEIRQICNNELVEYQGEKIRTFDLTEEKNSAEALQMLKECTFQ